jgi:phage terminase large subunit
LITNLRYLRAFFDIGGSGAQADAMAIWIVQWVGHQIRVLDYIEGVGQVLGYYVNELRSRKLHPVCYLPHEGINANNITGKRYRNHLEEAGFDVVVITNQGHGAAMMRIEAVRRIKTTEAGRSGH